MDLLLTPLYVKENLFHYVVACLEVKVLTFILTDSVQTGDSFVSEPLISRGNLLEPCRTDFCNYILDLHSIEVGPAFCVCILDYF